MLLPKPYKLYNKIQHYSWGTKNADAFIPKFLGIAPEADVPYAELWIGAHPSASSEVEANGTRTSLFELVRQYPAEILGERTAKKFNNTFPFLLKILSASQALSIQTHPTKEQAALLHQNYPQHYPDDNHKPEIAVAVDSLLAIAGFRPADEIVRFIMQFSALRKFDNEGIIQRLIKEKEEDERKKLLVKFYASIMRSAEKKELLKEVIDAVLQQLASIRDITREEDYFIMQFGIYGYDVGLFSFFFFNFIQLRSGQAIFTPAGVPHAYLSGTIVECMANSDNVVRAGLTPKYKDVETLLQILRADFSNYEIINEEQKNDDVQYITAAEEFVITKFSVENKFTRLFKTKEKPVVLLMMSGKIEIQWNGEGEKKSLVGKKGEAYLLPSITNEVVLSAADEASFFYVTIPE
ncbi:MAG: mannose-6-phosphate isomerase, class I [Bacteroidetes bacterium]|nr:mannose-6-phosphate isomerase, class I [Bacteroidota bacterium]